MPHAPATHAIKRYSNHQSSMTRAAASTSRQEQIAEMIRQGEEVRVLDNSSKEDLGHPAQIIFEEEKRQKSFIPLGAMRHLIQSGGASLQEQAQQAQARVMSVFRQPREPGREREEGDEAGLSPESEIARAAGRWALSWPRRVSARSPRGLGAQQQAPMRAVGPNRPIASVSSSIARSRRWKSGSVGSMSACVTSSTACRPSPAWPKTSRSSACASPPSKSSSSTCRTLPPPPTSPRPPARPASRRTQRREVRYPFSR